MTSKNSEMHQCLVLDQHKDSDWKELPQWVRETAAELGYTKRLWNHDEEPESCHKNWKNLSTVQQEAAKRLGYTEKLWNDEDDSSSSSSNSSDDDKYEDERKVETSNPSIVVTTKQNTIRPKRSDLCLQDVHKHPKWTIYCIQLYTKTNDYKFRVEEGTGLTMYANRPLEANEFLIQSPVGPCIHEGLFEVNNNNNNQLSEERSGFAERFLEWHHTHGTTSRDGAQNARVDIRLEDFSNPSTTPRKHRCLPQKSNQFVYDLEIFEHEIVLVEFVPPPSDLNHSLPPLRRFELLNYDEGLVGMYGEQDYDPYALQRPPTLCGMEERSLELPGHFSNHASGASSTAYDFVRPGSILSSFPPICKLMAKHAKDLPEFLKEELAFKQSWIPSNLPPTDDTPLLFTHMTARRALGAGTEITTDYSRWHWSNADLNYYGDSRKTPVGYFRSASGSERWEWDHLPPKILRGAKILGFTRELWKSEASPLALANPWGDLSLQERQAVIDLTGHTKDSWDKRSGIKNKENKTTNDHDASSQASVDDLDWVELSEEQRTAATIIGFTEPSWNDGSFANKDVMGDDLYFYNLRPEVRDAMVLLGEAEFTWEEEDDCDGEHGEAEPWFECVCGDSECHSSKEKGGFRGVKYFSLQDQCRVGPLCEPWVQQQLLWRLYQLEQQQHAHNDSEKER